MSAQRTGEALPRSIVQEWHDELELLARRMGQRLDDLRYGPKEPPVEGPKALGRVASYPACTAIEVHGDFAFKKGMLIAFGAAGSRRAGFARVEHVSDSHGTTLYFDDRLNILVPTVCEGDLIYEYEIPCSRCQCKRCSPPSSSNPEKP